MCHRSRLRICHNEAILASTSQTFFRPEQIGSVSEHAGTPRGVDELSSLTPKRDVAFTLNQNVHISRVWAFQGFSSYGLLECPEARTRRGTVRVRAPLPCMPRPLVCRGWCIVPKFFHETERSEPPPLDFRPEGLRPPRTSARTPACTRTLHSALHPCSGPLHSSLHSGESRSRATRRGRGGGPIDWIGQTHCSRFHSLIINLAVLLFLSARF
mmetsp:Transcript_58511/g.154325  ORF Transcript_58511/g.154325 Transcript_58511/m.154325 type:complete len:213 (+) Transcript_58511:76-714(+)